MKPVLALLSVVFLLGLMMCPLAVIGADDENQLGLYYDADATVYETEISPNTRHNLYLVLTNPVNDNYDGGGTREVSYVSGFECAVEPPSGDFVLDVQFPVQAINLGEVDNVFVGFASEVPVTSERAATLATFSVLSLGNNRTGYFLSPATPSSRPGTMAYVDAEDPEYDNIVDMHPASGSYDQAVFWFGDWHIDEVRQWGAVKSLFR